MDDRVQQLAAHVTEEIRQQRRGRGEEIQITEDTPLVSSGLIDSLSLVSLLQKLEDVTHTRLPVSKIQPKDMNTVSLMLATADRLGKPRNR
jgi:acyl carrier protein